MISLSIVSKPVQKLIRIDIFISGACIYLLLSIKIPRVRIYHHLKDFNIGMLVCFIAKLYVMLILLQRLLCMFLRCGIKKVEEYLYIAAFILFSLENTLFNWCRWCIMFIDEYLLSMYDGSRRVRHRHLE